GRKMVWRCDDCLTEKVTGETATAPKCPNCAGKMGKLLALLLSKGRLSKALPSADHIRESVLDQLGRQSALYTKGFEASPLSINEGLIFHRENWELPLMRREVESLRPPIFPGTFPVWQG